MGCTLVNMCAKSLCKQTVLVFFKHSVHSSNKPRELSQWLCHDDSTINIAICIIIFLVLPPQPMLQRKHLALSAAASVRLIFRPVPNIIQEH